MQAEQNLLRNSATKQHIFLRQVLGWTVQGTADLLVKNSCHLYMMSLFNKRRNNLLS